MEYSDKLINFYKSIRDTSRKPIKIVPVLDSNYYGATGEREDCFLIRLSISIPEEFEEIVLAHELMHVKQLSEGYPQIINDVFNPAEYDSISKDFVDNFSSWLNTSILDANVHMQLKQFDYDDSVLREERIQAFEDFNAEKCNFDFSKEHHQLDFIIQILNIFLIIPEPRIQSVVKNLSKKYPSLMDRTIRIYEKIRNIGCSTSEQVLNCFIMLFEEFKIGKYMSIEYYNPKLCTYRVSGNDSLIF